MNKFLKTGALTLPAFLLLITFITLTLSGCSNGSGGNEGKPPYNEDSVKKHIIPLSDAVRFVKDFRGTVDIFNRTCPGFKDSLIMGYSEAFNSDSYKLLLAQKDSAGHPAAGIRIYYGIKNGQLKLILVPYDSSGNNIFNRLISGSKTPNGTAKTESLVVDGPQVLEQGQHCPPICPPTNPLDPQ